MLWALALLALVPVASTFGQEGSPIVADKEGWWNVARDASAGTPVPMLPDTVPEHAIGIAAKAGQVEKVAALGIVLDADRGSVVERFTLTLTEAEGIGAQQGEGAIVACPIVDFFAGEENGPMINAPAADCEAANVEGVRADDGTWSFDLVPIADAWLDPFGTINANGIRLDPIDTGTFQVSLTGMEDAAFDVAISVPVEDNDPFDSSTTTIAGGFSGSGASPSSGSAGFAVSPPPAVAAPVENGGATTATTAVVADAEADATSASSPSRVGETVGNLPGGFPFLVVVGAALALLLAWHLGPAGRVSHTKNQRSGGVSRALAARNSPTGATP